MREAGTLSAQPVDRFVGERIGARRADVIAEGIAMGKEAAEASTRPAALKGRRHRVL